MQIKLKKITIFSPFFHITLNRIFVVSPREKLIAQCRWDIIIELIWPMIRYFMLSMIIIVSSCVVYTIHKAIFNNVSTIFAELIRWQMTVPYIHIFHFYAIYMTNFKELLSIKDKKKNNKIVYNEIENLVCCAKV